MEIIRFIINICQWKISVTKFKQVVNFSLYFIWILFKDIIDEIHASGEKLDYIVSKVPL